MPYRSKAQEAYFNANRAKLERQGVNVDEWNAASKGKKLPDRVGGPMKKKSKEIGIPKGASKVIKAKDEAYDKKHGVKEGSRKDLAADKRLMKSAKKGK